MILWSLSNSYLSFDIAGMIKLKLAAVQEEHEPKERDHLED
jgi:hypothetical protein